MSDLPGCSVTDEELRAVGFRPHELAVRRTDVLLADGVACEWDTIGDVPDSAGLYAFTVDDGLQQTVVYVGMTTHLWMITKGRLPGQGGARGPQRYGRAKHAGATRRRVNIAIAEQIRAGRRVRHWLLPLLEPQLRLQEEALIQRWQLRTLGWNRG